MVWHIDVDFPYPGDEEVTKGKVVRLIKWNMSWVKYVVRQYGFYLLITIE